MPKLKITASWPQLDRQAFVNEYLERLTNQMVLAARSFLLAAVPRVPIWTGFARGGFQNLEERIGRVESGKIKRQGRIDPRKRTTTLASRRGYYYKGVERTNLNSKPFGTPKDKIITQGRVTKATTAGRLVFFYEINIDYFTVLDEKKWGAFKAGEAAFTTDLRARLARFNLSESNFIIKKEVK